MDREKVIKGLECCTFILGKRKCDECPYQKDNGCYQMQDDFHTLLKEQDAVVRCKDCVYGMMFKNVKDEQRFECVSPTHNGTYVEAHDPDWFCADGVRR